MMPSKVRQVLCLLFTIEFANAKLYERCELAKELKYIYEFPQSELSTWACIAQHESLLNTSAMNHGSGDHGLFQISQVYWCSPPGQGCNTACANFRDDNIADDVKCVRKIFKEHQRLFGNGFQAWAVYPLYCNRDTTKYIEGCFENEIDNSISVIEEEKPLPLPEEEDDDGYEFPPLPTSPKIYNPCELAKELRYVHKLPEDQISKWVCIVEHESNYNTSARNPGSGDHGLFQISEQYWCSRNSVGYGCNANCASFRDNYIADDVKCVRRIYDEHTAISGDGFDAWAVYPLYCKGDTSRYIERCQKVHKTTEKQFENEYNFPPLPSTPKTVLDNTVVNSNDDREYDFPALPSLSVITPKNTLAPTFKSSPRGGNPFDLFSHYYTSTPQPTAFVIQSSKSGSFQGKVTEGISQKSSLLSTYNRKSKSTLNLITQPVTSSISSFQPFVTTPIPAFSKVPPSREYSATKKQASTFTKEYPTGTTSEQIFSSRIGKIFQETTKFQTDISTSTAKRLVAITNKPSMSPKYLFHSSTEGQLSFTYTTPKPFSSKSFPDFLPKQLVNPTTNNSTYLRTTKKPHGLLGIKKSFGPPPFNNRPPPPRPPPPRPSRPSRPSMRPQSPPPLPPQGLPRPIVTFTPLYTEIPPSTSVYLTTPKTKQVPNKVPQFSARGAFANFYHSNVSLKPFSSTTSRSITNRPSYTEQKRNYSTLKLSTDLKSDFSNEVSQLVDQNSGQRTSTNKPPSEVIRSKITVEEFPGYTFLRTAFGFKLFQKH